MHWFSFQSAAPSPFHPISRTSPFSPVARNDPSLPFVLHELPPRFRKSRPRPDGILFEAPAMLQQWDHVRYTKVNAWPVLQQHAMTYHTARQTGAPESNGRAVAKGYGAIEVKRAPRASFFSEALHESYIERLKGLRIPLRPLITPLLPQARVIRTEGDVGDATLVDNILPVAAILLKLTPLRRDATLVDNILPVAAILNALLNVKGRHDLQVVVQHQTCTSDFATGQAFVESERTRITDDARETEEEPAGDKQKRVVYHPCTIDHALVLVSRCALRHHDGELREQAHLVIVEEKRPTYIVPEQWRWCEDGTVCGGNMLTHLPQLLMYAREFECGRLIVTDQTSAIAVRLSVKKVNPHSEIEVPLAFEKLQKNKTGSVRSQNTFRHALCKLAIEALLSMGVLDGELMPVPLQFDEDGNCSNLQSVAKGAAEEGLQIGRMLTQLDDDYKKALQAYNDKPKRNGRNEPVKPEGYGRRWKTHRE